MAKPQRRTAAAASRAARETGTAPHARPIKHVSSTTDQPGSSSTNTKRPRYLEAVAVYEQGIRLIQQHDFARAADLFNRVVAAFPEERELCERGRLYLTLCDRQLRPALDEPQSLSERIYAATLALNAGDTGRAIDYLESVHQADPANDQALYMLASAHAQRGNVQVAIPYLQQAIESNPDNRVLARSDPDLAGLRAEDTIAALLESPFDSHHKKRALAQGTPFDSHDKKRALAQGQPFDSPDKSGRSLRARPFDSHGKHAGSLETDANGGKRSPRNRWA
jgi:tetratricopeptide (TPR) repeat protein